MKMIMIMKWPEVFTDKNFTYPIDKDAMSMAVADAYSGWGNCKMGKKNDIPEHFGEGMVKIGKIIGCAPIEKNLDKLHEKIMKGS